MNKKLSIIVPVYNEVETVLILLNKLIKLNLYNNFTSEIIIVDDNSTDGTKELLKNLEKETPNTNLKFIYKSKNSGKGSSQKLAIPLCTGDFTIIQDADLEYNPKDYYKLLKPFKIKNTQVVYGSRVLGRKKITFSSHFTNFSKSFRIFGNYILTKIKVRELQL